MYRPHTNPQQRATHRVQRMTQTASQRRHWQALIASALVTATLFAACSDDGSTEAGVNSTAVVEIESPSTASAASASSAPPASPVSSEPAGDETAPATSTMPVPVADDGALATAALLTADDIGDGWEQMSSEFDFPNSAELARTVPECEQFAELVFDGGEQHGAGASEALGSGEDLVFTYVVVFPTVKEASAMLDAVDSTAFDTCWARFNDVAVTEFPFGIESGTYASHEPPQLSLTAHDSTVKYLDGSFVMAGDTIPDTCVCVFAQVGRGIVEFHSPAPIFDPARRSEVVQAAIDRLQTTLGAPVLDVAGFLDAAESTESDIGTGINYVTDPVAKGRYDTTFRQRQEAIEACSSIDRLLLNGATYDESIDGRGWLYVDLDSPQLPYIAHTVMVLADDTTAQAVITDLRAATDLPTCIASWIADVNGDDASSRNAPWASSTIEYSVVDADFGEPLDGLGDDQLTITWQQHLKIDGTETAPENMTFVMARIGPTIFTFSGNDPDRTAAAAALLADRTRDALI